MLKQNRKSLFFLLILLITCAHKAPPLSKDRLRPRLRSVSALNKIQIQLTFSEDLDTLTLKQDNFLIWSNNDTLEILTLYPSLSASEIVVVTEPMKEKSYEVRGEVYDKAENMGSFKAIFKGSSVADTIAPWLFNYSKGKNNREFQLKFSEAMDTTFLRYYIIPKREFETVWNNYRSVTITTGKTDSLSYDTTYYLYIKEARDLSGNLLIPFITSITADTIYDPLIMRGKVMLNDTIVKSGLAVLRREIVLGITKIDNGEFMFEVRDSLPFNVIVVTNGYSGQGEIFLGKEIIINLQKREIDIDSIVN